MKIENKRYLFNDLTFQEFIIIDAEDRRTAWNKIYNMYKENHEYRFFKELSEQEYNYYKEKFSAKEF